MLTQFELKKVFNYNKKTGDFTRKKEWCGKKIGSKAGCKSCYGYLTVNINKKRYSLHRLAWLYVYGYFPENNLDHIDRNPSNNKIDNLREASKSCNIRNTGNWKNNKSGVKGVTWEGRRWRSGISSYGKYIALGRYKSFDDAVCARLAGEQALNWSDCDSSSPAFQYVKKYIQRVNLDA